MARDGYVPKDGNAGDLAVGERSLAGFGVVESIVAGANITVNNADPQHPIVSAAGAAGTSLTFVAADPIGAPAVGHEMQYNTVDGKLWIWDGAAWKGVQLA